tara:strand:- start:545 stop:1396 length:852 start_codon:yes stop_codon:yes gene_type:complete
MAKYARGKKSLAISDVGGLRVPYTQLKTTWDGLRVSPEDFDPKQPQLTPAKNVVDATALFNPRPDTDPENVAVFIGYTQDWTIDPRLRPSVGVSAPGFIGFTGLEVIHTVTGVGGTANVGTVEATIQTEIIASGQAGDGEVGAVVREIVVTGVGGTAGTASVGVEALDISLDEAGVGGTGGVGTEAVLLEATLSGVGGSSNVGNEEPVGEINEVGVSGDGEIGTAIVEDPFGWGIGPWGLGPWGDTEGRPHPVGQAGAGGVSSVTITIETAWGIGGYGEGEWQ